MERTSKTETSTTLSYFSFIRNYNLMASSIGEADYLPLERYILPNLLES